MDEKETTTCLCSTGKCNATCEIPPCMSHPAKLSPEPTVREVWKDIRFREFIKIDTYFDTHKCPVMTGCGYSWRENYKKMWDIVNPMPKRTLREAYNQALTRISELEATLAEKGGLR